MYRAEDNRPLGDMRLAWRRGEPRDEPRDRSKCQTMEHQRERDVAIQAVQVACRLCELAREPLTAGDTLTKLDYSPVTIADYGVQASVSSDFQAAFSDTPLAAEEDTRHLRDDASGSMHDRLLILLRRVGRDMRREALLAAIERGSHPGGAQGRFWTLDPIDGTKGFLRGGQYAIALALIEDGNVVLGVLGCPRLPIDATRPDQGTGCVFVAVRGQGVIQMTLDGASEQPVRVSATRDPSRASICESADAEYSDQAVSRRVADLLRVTAPPLRMDSQCKYAAIARGDAAIYLRLPTPASLASGYEEKIWDHAAGSLVAEMAGGVVSDMNGRPLDFSQGRALKANHGVITTNGHVHAAVLDAVRQAGVSTPR